MPVLFANPYDISVVGFYFTTIEGFESNSDKLEVEEFEIEFIDGETIDAELFKALDVTQNKLQPFFEACADWDDDLKVRVIIASNELGYTIDVESPDVPEIDLYDGWSIRDLAEHFIEEGLFGPIDDAILPYIDYDAVARDLSMDYDQVYIGGNLYTYRSF